MKIIKSFCVAIAMYSKIPVPMFDWNEENMKYSIAFFPFVGVVIIHTWIERKNSKSLKTLISGLFP